MSSANIIDGRILAQNITNELTNTINTRLGARKPGLATILVGDDRASAIYVANKRKRAEEVGIKSFHFQLAQDSFEEDILQLVASLNHDPAVDAILVQLPLPKHLNEQKIIESLDPAKDGDGIHPLNLGYLLRGDPRVLPCTPSGIMHILHASNFPISGKHAVVVGRSTIVGKPIAHLLLQENATVTICHSKTENLAQITNQADILIAAVGRARLINRSFVKEGAFVIDVGINRDANNKLCGDVDFADVTTRASYITPVPFGVGPLTIAMLLKNTVANFLRRTS